MDFFYHRRRLFYFHPYIVLTTIHAYYPRRMIKQYSQRTHRIHYNQNLINMLEVDNFHKIIENEIINKCNECSLDYNESKKNITNNKK